MDEENNRSRRSLFSAGKARTLSKLAAKIIVGSATQLATAVALSRNNFAKEWAERQRGQTFEPDQIVGGCALLKKETIQKMGQFPSRTPLGNFDLQALSQRVRQLGNRLVGAKEVFVHNFGARGNWRP